MKYSKYPSYKDSGVEWLGEIPEHWEDYRIDWVNTIIRGNTGFKKDELLNTGEYVALQYGKTYKVDEIDGTFKYYVNSEFYKPNQVVNYGDTIFISTSETVKDLGHSCFYNRSDLGLIGGEQILLKPNTKVTFDKYFYFYSKVFSNELRRYATGLKVFRFNIDDLKNIFISLPPLQEQKAIATYLDRATQKIDTLIAKQSSLIALLKEKRQALISHAVTKGLDPDVKMKESGVEWLGEIPERWEVWKFIHFAPIITCGLASTPTYVDEGIPFLSAQNIQNGELSLHKYNYITEELHKQLTKNRKPEKNDLLVTRVGAKIGEACVLNIDMDFSIYVSLSQIRLNPLIALPNYIRYFLASLYCSMLNTLGTEQGGGVGNLNVKNVERYKVPLASLPEQQKIATYLDQKTQKIDTLITKATQAITLLKEKRTALISAVVTGKVDVRGEVA